jgi:hypothetical protein
MSTMQGVVSQGSMDASGLSSELSMGDIVDAMKAKNAQKHDDNKFISTLGKQFKVTEDEESGSAEGEAGIKSEITMTSDIANCVQDKISEVQDHTEQVLGRQAEISQSLKSYQQNPFAT